MKKLNILILLGLFFLFLYEGESQVIKGFLKNKDSFYYNITLSIGNINETIDIHELINKDSVFFSGSQFYPDSLFFLIKLDSFSVFPDSILFKTDDCAKLKINNLPSNYDSLNLGVIELLKHRIIYPNTYDSIRKELFDKQPPGFLVDQKQKVDSILKNRYLPVRHWLQILYYVDTKTLVDYSIQHPFCENKEIQVDYNQKKELIRLDYNKIKIPCKDITPSPASEE